ncbi:hypothetical protein BJ085DRAFT_36967 [Dimargaris cristalligena]|uniref:RING-type domain-containing protein n=1 Tax=Dimargaris cristalligena TaxID=215637 RepID=A0A4V1J5V9_9FUNG|nr:hypothetical protein BJ085DRAFT_36967 [Dimargaris cristalligena]|eukprot:RKP40419.1 hypothetical protein BJ085DRAFT_36967 [Dimargaris cristalligena]
MFGSDYSQQDSESSRVAMIIVGSLGGAFGLIVVVLVARCILRLRRRQDRARARAERRRQGIESLSSRVGRSRRHPLDPQLLVYLPIIDTKRTDVSSLEQPADTAEVDEIPDDDTSGMEIDLGESSLSMQSGPITPMLVPTSTHPTGNLSAVDEKMSVRIIGTGTSPTTSNVHEACAICIDYITKGQKLRQLPCKHLYHVECIDQWLVDKSATCPLCKFNVAKHCIAKAGPRYRSPPRKKSPQPIPDLAPAM